MQFMNCPTLYIDGYYKDHPGNENDELALESYIPLSPGTKIDAQDLYPAKDTFKLPSATSCGNHQGRVPFGASQQAIRRSVRQ